MGRQFTFASAFGATVFRRPRKFQGRVMHRLGVKPKGMLLYAEAKISGCETKPTME